MAILLIYFYLSIFYVENMLQFRLSSIPGLSLFNLSVYLLIFAWTLSILVKKKLSESSGINIYIILLISFVIFSIPYQMLFNNELVQNPIADIIMLKKWLNPFIIFFCIYNILNNENTCKKTLYSLNAILLLSALITPLYSIGFLNEHVKFDFYEGRAAAFAEPNQYAAYLVLFFPMVITHTLFSNKVSSKIINGAILLMAFIAFITTGSRGGLISLILSISYYSYSLYRERAFKFNRLVLLSVALIVFIPMAFILAPSKAKHTFIERLNPTKSVDANYYTAGRLEHLRLGLHFFIERPFLGHGISGYSKLWQNRYGSGGSTHNQYVDYLVSFGLIGLALYLSIYIKLFKVTYRYMRSTPLLFDKLLCISYLAGLVGYCFAMLAVNLSPDPRFLFWIYTAAILKYFKLKATAPNSA